MNFDVKISRILASPAVSWPSALEAAALLRSKEVEANVRRESSEVAEREDEAKAADRAVVDVRRPNILVAIDSQCEVVMMRRRSSSKSGEVVDYQLFFRSLMNIGCPMVLRDCSPLTHDPEPEIRN